MVQSIPEGYATVTPCLAVKDCAKVMETYKTAFGAKELSRTQCPETGKVMHAEMQIGNSRIMMSDLFPGCPAESSGSFYLYVPDCDAAMAKAKNAGFTETMPAEEMFWGDRLGAVKDNCGISWTIATHVKDVSEEDIQKGAKEMAAKMKEAGKQKVA